MLFKRPTLALAILILNCTFAFAQKPAWEYKEPDWAFPRVGMEKRTSGNGKTIYKLDEDFWATYADFNGVKTAGVTFPPSLDRVIDRLNKAQAGAVPNRDQFIVAVVLMKAVVTPEDYLNEYLGDGMFQGTRLHFFKTASGAYIGGAVSEDRTFVMLIPAPDPDKLQKEKN